MTLVPVDTTSTLAVTDYLTKARDWLATAVEQTGPEQIAAAKAEIATAAEATKQLGLSKEIQEDAEEMVRRAQYALRKSQLKEQDEGRMRSRATNLKNQPERSVETSTSFGLPTPREFFSSEVEYRDSSAMGALAPDEFDEVIDEARAEGNLSRANVARKAREKSGLPRPAKEGTNERRHQEAELINAFASIVKRSLTPQNVSTLSPKAKARITSILEAAIATLRGTDQ